METLNISSILNWKFKQKENRFIPQLYCIVYTTVDTKISTFQSHPMSIVMELWIRPISIHTFLKVQYKVENALSSYSITATISKHFQHPGHEADLQTQPSLPSKLEPLTYFSPI